MPSRYQRSQAIAFPFGDSGFLAHRVETLLREIEGQPIMMVMKAANHSIMRPIEQEELTMARYLVLSIALWVKRAVRV